jgi:3-oxoacyl-[acyl-carrier protein] reductase
MRNNNGYVLVTGAGSGIGLAIVESLLVSGVTNLICQYRSRNIDLFELLKNHNLYPENVAFQAELTSEEDVKSLREFGTKKFGKIYAVINVAGASTNSMSWKISKEKFLEIINANLLTAFLCSREFIPEMREEAIGRIINFSSVVAYTGTIGSAHYCAAKSGLLGLSKAMSLELASKNITVNTIALGYFDRGLINDVSPELQEEVKSKIPMKRFGHSTEIAALVNYILSEDSKYTTGQVFHINGGLY